MTRQNYDSKKLKYSFEDEFFFILSDQRYAVDNFIKSLDYTNSNSLNYVSQSCYSKFDIDELCSYFTNINDYLYVKQSIFKKISNKYDVISLAVQEDEDIAIINFFLTLEVDRFSKYKLYDITKE